MAFIAGQAKKAVGAWVHISHCSLSPSTHAGNFGLQWNRICVREIRTRAITRRRPATVSGIEPDLTQLSSQLTADKLPPPPDAASGLDTPIQATSSRRRIQQGFPTIEEDSRRPRKQTSNDSTYRPSASASKSSHSASPPPSEQSQVQHPPSNTERKDKFPKKLEAFPFVPGATTSELAKAHKFFLLPAAFVKSATTLEMIPENTAIPEVVFIGRSNIGKSSLINGLVNRNGLVKTSSKPGHTRMMNFFKIGDKLSLVDMPGYGWKSRDEWGDMILSYLQNRKNLRRIYILVDPSHGLKDSDLQIMKLLDGSGLSYQVVLTKMDRLSRTKYGSSKAEIEAQLVKDAICCFPMVLGVSSRTRDGLDELRAAVVKASQLGL